jgi:hypothetical protein
MEKRRITTCSVVSAIFLAAYLPGGFSARAAETHEASSKSGRLAGRTAVPRPQRELERRMAASARLERQHVQMGAGSGVADEVALLKEQMAFQQKQIEQLRLALEEQRRRLEQALQTLQAASVQAPDASQVASLRPALPAGTRAEVVPLPPTRTAAATSPAPSSQAEIQQYTHKVDELATRVDSALKNLAGFKLSGDFRFRADVQARSGNDIAGPLQNVRSRYRLRLNLDKELDPRFRFHLQLSTGPLNNGITNDQDFAATVAKHPFSIAEAYVEFHPGANFALRGGRMEEVFADNMRFLWDDDVRFNGFQQIVRVPLSSNPLGLKSLQFRAGEYFLSNPNVVILSSTSPFTVAGYQVGQKVRDANLFHPGVVLEGSLGANWSHQFASDIQIYRNPNQIQLASLASGYPVVVSNGLGIALAGPMTGAGNATTAPGGAIYSARGFQIVRVAYRLERPGWTLRGRTMPLWLDFQASRNTGTSKLRDAFMASANVGAVKGFGDVRFLYQFAIKDANSLISQFTDDDLGTGTGVNISVHALRFDLGLARFLQWQNLLFIQDERRPSNPAEQFFVPLQRGAKTTFRYLGQLAFTF